MEEIYDIANELGYDTVRTERKFHDRSAALIGFDSYEEAKKVAEEYGYEVVSISAGIASDRWYRDRVVNGPYKLDDCETDMAHFYRGNDREDVLAQIDVATDELNKMLEDIQSLRDGQFLCVDENGNRIIKDIECMEYTEDSRKYKIAVVESY